EAAHPVPDAAGV
ncbi:MAG: hypothetical protein COW45_07410, partial [Gallionellales bacterium CG17_big_fil_post_rev_8_21_14_2_50_54_146]